MSKYSIADLKQLEKIMSSFNNSSIEEDVEDTEEDMEIMQMNNLDAENFFASLQNPELPIEQQIEESFILRTFCGRAAIRLHGRSTPKQIFW